MREKHETKIKKKIFNFLTKNMGGYVLKMTGSHFQINGIPDIICCINGRFVAVEVKTKNGKLSKLQALNLQNIKKARGIGLVITDDENIDAALIDLVRLISD